MQTPAALLVDDEKCARDVNTNIISRDDKELPSVFSFMLPFIVPRKTHFIHHHLFMERKILENAKNCPFVCLFKAYESHSVKLLFLAYSIITESPKTTETDTAAVCGVR